MLTRFLKLRALANQIDIRPTYFCINKALLIIVLFVNSHFLGLFINLVAHDSIYPLNIQPATKSQLRIKIPKLTQIDNRTGSRTNGQSGLELRHIRDVDWLSGSCLDGSRVCIADTNVRELVV